MNTSSDTQSHVLITGASGFVGRHVLRELQTAGVQVTAVTRDVAHLGAFQGTCEIRALDLRAATVAQFRELASHDILIHLAWGGLPNYRSLHHFEEELPAQYAFLAGLARAGLKAMLLPGTCFEYGMQSGQLSEALPCAPTNPYGFAKDMLRKQLEYLKPFHNFNLTWARLFYMWGEGQAETSLRSQLERAVQRGDRQFNMSGGEQLRDFLPVTEVARIIVSLALRRQDTGIVNVCSGRPQSVRSLVEGWIREKGWNIAPNLGHYPYPDYEPLAFWGDRTKLATLI